MATKMQDLALAEGALPRHLNTSLFTLSADNRLLTHRSDPAPHTTLRRPLNLIAIVVSTVKKDNVQLV